MLDQEIKQAYKKITPSSELEQKILNMSPTWRAPKAKVLILRRVATVAACTVLLLGGMLWMRQIPMEVLMPDGAVLSENAISIEPQYFGSATARTVEGPAIASYSADTAGQIAIPLTFSAKGKLSISVESGSLMISFDGDNSEEYVEAGQSVEKLDGDTALYWILPLTDEDAVYDMTVNRKHTVRVMYDAEQQKYTISHVSGKS